MPRYDFTTQRLHTRIDLDTGAVLQLDRAQANYLLNVLRLGDGDAVLLFNGRDGEWQATVRPDGRKAASLVVAERTRAQTSLPDLQLLFAPLKQARLEYMVQKAVEMGVGRLTPVRTEFTNAKPPRTDKAGAYIIEAAEQCGILAVPTMDDMLPLAEALEPSRRLIFCDEGEASQNPLDPLRELERGPLTLLIGPEGGFSEAERAMLRGLPNVTPMPLGPR
ncbi:MAG: 16S rRNA (uracil(1498)-N(3))-methyltransferase, partial [Pseudomonadota bacterium]